MEQSGQSDLNYLRSNLSPIELQLQLPSTPGQVAQAAAAPPRLYHRRATKKAQRPSTAPGRSAKEKTHQLPSLTPNDVRDSRTAPSSPEVGSSSREVEAKKKPSTDSLDSSHPPDDVEGSSSKRNRKGRMELGSLPSPFATSTFRREDIVVSRASEETQLDMNDSDYDWASFMSAYANGRWDPNCIPKFPGSHSITSTGGPASAPNTAAQWTPPDSDSAHGSPPSLINECQKSDVQSLPPPTNSISDSPPRPASTVPIIPRPKPTSQSPDRLRMTFAELRAGNGNLPSNVLSSNTMTHHNRTPSNPDVAAAAATMRWAAAHVNLSPLALPSPERELTDPMRGVTAAIPGSLPNDFVPSHELMTPGGSRRSRLANFWQGTSDVEPDHAPQRRLSTIEGSPANTPEQIGSPEPRNISSSRPPVYLPAVGPVSVPASAPIMNKKHESSTDSYFSDVVPSDQVVQFANDTSPVFPHTPALLDQGTVSVPALPRRICLARQTSSPLPSSMSREPRYSLGRVKSATGSIASVKNSRSAMEEQMFTDLKYLAPPNPPDELERRRALYKFNLWNTGPDLSFDRIAHLAKLVFNTKGVFISLVDSTEQWFKSEWGMKKQICMRNQSFCGHTILQRGDEPMVILDTHEDWRFKNNPLVVGEPNIRFYAGAPLRTQDGFNIGSLAVVCDTPRTEFSPRQRHTLKEFAAIAMREMELWRDKIQLRIRDRIQNSMEQFSRECLEIDEEQPSRKVGEQHTIAGASMDKVYNRAAKLIQRTLDVEGAMVIDVSHSEVLETVSAEGAVSVVMYHGDPEKPKKTRQLSTEEYGRLNAFFAKYPDGKVSEGIVHHCFRPFLPTHIQYALIVPIFNIDKRPFALLCAYNATDPSKRFLEGYELSYLRAIGVIILSAVLKRRMLLADKSKSLFISNISHELRTPLHGILAAVELLTETPLNHSQVSFLQTVQACGTSLVETVNHVLDFTKLSGNSKAGGIENVIPQTKVELMQLVEEAVDGCWIGHRARTAELRETGIGSVYSPPQEGDDTSQSGGVETIVDVGYREGGWMLKCEKGGIRRVLTNLFGNSLKFTTKGYVHISLRQLPRLPGMPPNKVRLELSVNDTGKGISQNFLKNQLFHPFSQENPLQTGTGLGLAIVNSIVQSETVGGKVDVCSEEGVGTEIKITFNAETCEEDEESAQTVAPLKFDENLFPEPPTISFVGFHPNRRGIQLLHDVLQTYVCTWWGLRLQPADGELGDIVILNDDPTLIISATRRRDTSRPFVLLSSSRGNMHIMTVASDYERIGGFCRIIYKPGGPSRLRAVLKLCVHALKIIKQPLNVDSLPMSGSLDGEFLVQTDRADGLGTFSRRNSEEPKTQQIFRPRMMPRSTTWNPLVASESLASMSEEPDLTPAVEEPTSATIDIGTGGSLLRSSIGSADVVGRKSRVLVVEDNIILRQLLAKWLKSRGFDYRDAEDGRHGVDVFRDEGPFEVILLDMSMPVLDGVGATTEIREIELARNSALPSRETQQTACILALTGMSSLEDKRRAFAAGVDGYLVKPVAFKTLEEMFQKLGVS